MGGAWLVVVRIAVLPARGPDTGGETIVLRSNRPTSDHV
jgi:hypothetical protein